MAVSMEDLHSMETEPGCGIDVPKLAAETALVTGVAVVSIAFYGIEKGSELFKGISDRTGLTNRLDRAIDRIALLGSS